MANAPIPPLFCSTPPPIDDETSPSPINDDEDFGDFTNAYPENISDYMTQGIENDFDDFHSGVPNYFGNIQNEACNKTSVVNLFPSSNNNNNIPELDCDSREVQNECEDEVKIENDLNDELKRQKDNVSLSSMSEQQTSSATSISPESESFSNVENSLKVNENDDEDFAEFQFNDVNVNEIAKNESEAKIKNKAFSNEVEVKLKPLEHLNNVVLLEDIIDDSSDDERHSPRNRNNFSYCDETSEDFFAIHSVNSTNDEEKTLEIRKETDILDAISSKEEETSKEISKDDDGKQDDLNVDQVSWKSEQNQWSQEGLSENISGNSEEEHAGNISTNTLNSKEDDLNKKEEENVAPAFDSVNFEADFDDFADFQDFNAAPNIQNDWIASAEKAPEELLQTNQSETEINQVESEEQGSNDFDDDDDFGDFTEAPIVAPSPAVVAKQNSTSETPQFSGSHLKSVLDNMFPSNDTNPLNSEPCDTLAVKDKISKIVAPKELAIVESAKALEYQWTNSNMRHSLIKSLGIDSRNIFLTEKWNPTMPRFAANLSFDPLQPLKPTSASASMDNSSSAANATTTARSEVPVAEFDWKSSGLVNPLDGPQEGTATQSIVASNTESSASNDNEKGNDTSSSSSYASAEAPAAVATASGATLSANATGDSPIDSAGKNINHNADIGALIAQEITDVTPDVCTETEITENVQSIATTEALETLGCGIIESSTSLEFNNSNSSVVDINIENGVVSRSTFAGPFKETHIFTPSQTETELSEKSLAGVRTSTMSSTPPTKAFPIDFDYEKAAAGIIIDETVVRKEYRDVEYNPGFSLEATQTQRAESPAPKTSTVQSNMGSFAPKDDFDDEFTDFQSVPPQPEPPKIATAKVDKMSVPASHGGMILSPAILLPQAISIESKQPKIEWGESAASINPEELARIEELFSHDNGPRNDSKKSSPTHSGGRQQQNSLSISAKIANKSQSQNATNHFAAAAVDDEDWSDFVSVPPPPPPSSSSSSSTASATTKSLNAGTVMSNRNNSNVQMPSPQRSRQQNNIMSASNSNDDEWSDFVSSTPNANIASNNIRGAPPTVAGQIYGMPQFNSASWQNANFYNNPLSIYHKNSVNAMPNATPTAKLHNNNYTNYNNSNNQSNNNFTQHLPAGGGGSSGGGAGGYPTTQHQQHQQQQQLQQQQQIQIMQDFSTATVSSYRPQASLQSQAYMTSNYSASSSPAPFQVGSAKIAPTVSLIPDLGFVAPAMPVHTAIINALPKPTSNMKK